MFQLGVLHCVPTSQSTACLCIVNKCRRIALQSWYNRPTVVTGCVSFNLTVSGHIQSCRIHSFGFQKLLFKKWLHNMSSQPVFEYKSLTPQLVSLKVVKDMCFLILVAMSGREKDIVYISLPISLILWCWCWRSKESTFFILQEAIRKKKQNDSWSFCFILLQQ